MPLRHHPVPLPKQDARANALQTDCYMRLVCLGAASLILGWRRSECIAVRRRSLRRRRMRHGGDTRHTGADRQPNSLTKQGGACQCPADRLLYATGLFGRRVSCFGLCDCLAVASAEARVPRQISRVVPRRLRSTNTRRLSTPPSAHE